MVQLIACLLVVAALVILVLQNLSPVLSLVVLGNTVGALPFSVWLVGAIAIGMLFTLLTYQLVPQKRAYRPIGKRLNDPVPEPVNQFVDAPGDSSNRSPSGGPSAGPSSQFQTPTNRQNPYDNDWESFKAPEQWDDWGQQRGASPRPSAGDAYTDSVGDPIDSTVRDIESGWDDDNYDASARYAARQDTEPNIGWSEYSDQSAPQNQPTSRVYDQGWLYGNDANDEPPSAAQPGEPSPEELEDEVYDANYRVIIPPYDTKDKEG